MILTTRTLLPAVLLLLALPGAVLPCLAVSGPWQENEPSRVRLTSPWDKAPREGELRLGLEFEIIPGWHVYWKNSGDAGFPPVIDFAPTPVVARSELLFPAPERYELRGGLVAFGYEHHVIYPVRVQLDGETLDPSSETLTLAADLDYLVCEVDCIPYSYRLTLEQPLAAPGESPVAGSETAEIERWWARLPVSLDRDRETLPEVTTRGWLVIEDPAAPRLVVDLEGITAAGDGEGEQQPRIFLEPHEIFDTGRPERRPIADGLRFTVPLSFREVPKTPPTEARFAWTVTNLRPVSGEAGGAPLAVEARRTVPVSATGPEGVRPVGGTEDLSPLAVRLQRPALLASMALVTLTLALAAWGLLQTGRAKTAPAEGADGPSGRWRLRGVLGFVAVAGLTWFLYLLSRRISSERLALVELMLLTLGLLAWARTVVRRRWAVWLLTLLLLAGAACVPWLAA